MWGGWGLLRSSPEAEFLHRPLLSDLRLLGHLLPPRSPQPPPGLLRIR